MTKQEFDKIVAKYEEHKQELNHQYELGKLHGLIGAMKAVRDCGDYVPHTLYVAIDRQLNKLK